MKALFKFVATTAMAVATLANTSCSNSYKGKVELKNNVDSVSYALGISCGGNLKQMMARVPFTGVDSLAIVNAVVSGNVHPDFISEIKAQLLGNDAELNETAFRHGFTHRFIYDDKAQIADNDIQILFQMRQAEIRVKRDAERAAMAGKNLEAGKAFLAENAKKEGVVVLESGLQYKVLASGNGATPKVNAKTGASDKVKCNYEGRTIEGEVFDSSYERNQPATFPLTGVIPGWTEILQLMKEGDKWQVYIPAELAYGERGAGEKIGPNAALIFDIELLEVIKAQ